MNDKVNDTISTLMRVVPTRFSGEVAVVKAEIERLRAELSFIAHVDLVTNAYDKEHIAVSVKSWAKNVLDGVNHDGNNL